MLAKKKKHLTHGIISGIFVFVLFLNVGTLSAESVLPLDNEKATIAALDKIANEFAKMMSKYDRNKVKLLTPKDKRNLLVKSFSKSGYSYSKTLHKMASEGINLRQYQIAIFLLMPVSSGSDVKPEAVYSGQELEDVKTIMKMFENLKNN